MSEIVLLNELSKSRIQAASSGGGATQFSGSNFVVARESFPPHNISNNYYSSGPAMFAEHGGGQFSVTNAPWSSTSNGSMWHGIRPFTVNQTNGSISVGSYTSYSITNSGWFYGAANGSYTGNTVNRWDTGLPSNWRGYIRQWTVSGNSVSQSGLYTSDSSQPAWNSRIIPLYNGSTLIWNTMGYRDQDGQAWDFRWTGIGSNVTSFPSTSTNLPGNSNTSTQNIATVITNFGAVYKGASNIGTLRFYRQSSNGQPMISIMDSNGNNSSTISQGNVIGANMGPSTNAVGFDLSNGRQLFYTNTGSVILRNGSTLSDVTSQADWVPGVMNYATSTWPIRSYVALSADKWLMMTHDSPNELIKFSINPTTYKVNIEASSLVTLGTGSQEISPVASSQYSFITGTTNQFLVFCTTEGDRYHVVVTNNPLAGTS